MQATRHKIPYRYTKTELDNLLDTLTVLVDTREQKNRHILNYFDEHEIDHKSKKLNYGDYSFMLPENEELGIAKDIYFNDQLAIERKASLEELSSNFTQRRQQFENELIRANSCKLVLLVEDGRGYENILQHNYNTQYNPKSFIGSLMAFTARHDIGIRFLNAKYSGNFIRFIFHYWLREYLK